VNSKLGRFFVRTEDSRFRCELCPRLCTLRPGQRGFCYVRQAHDDGIHLETWGRSSGFCVDPVEKKPLNHFLPGSRILSFGTAGCNLGCRFCFHPDTLIATTAGMRRIEDLFGACEEKVERDGGQVGFPTDLGVWTRQMRRAAVAKVFAHPYSGELLSIKASCCPPIRATPNHKIFAASRGEPENIRLIPAAELTTDHFLVVPKRRAGDSVQLRIEEIIGSAESGSRVIKGRRISHEELVVALSGSATSAELAEMLGYHRAYIRKLRGQLKRGVLEVKVETSRPIELGVSAGRVRFQGERGEGLPEVVALTPELSWLLGYYCAEGYVTSHAERPNSHRLGFTAGPHEAHLAERAAQLLHETLGVQLRIVRRRTTISAERDSSSTARFFAALCGRSAKDKRVPSQVMQASEPVIRAFLEGYLAGDGHKSMTHLVGNTVSPSLACGLYELGLHLDLLPTFFVHEPAPTKEIEGRLVTQSTTFIVKFLRDRFEQRPAVSEHSTWRDAGEHFLVRVREIERVPYTGLVYNLEVDDPDHSYLAPFLAVSNCQNWDISKAKADDRLQSHAEPEQIAELAVRQGCESVAFTYNDPVIFAEYAMDTAVACRERGVRTVAVTAGYITRPAAVEFYAHMDAANIDLKAFSERFYEKLCFAHLGPVLETIAYVAHETDCWLELTTLLIPGENDSSAELEQLCRWCADTLGPDVPLHFTAFHPDFKLTDRARTPPETLFRARAIAHAHGLHYVYTGNIHDRAGSTTCCPSCGKELVIRDGYRVLTQGVRDGRCGCGQLIAGRW
jgi:AmmeMemoRadiSam system radical SAM enzyme